jgi:hypothetical protein
MEKEDNYEPFTGKEDRRLPPCTHAAEWTEHARFYEEDEPCDDGRGGHLCGMKKGKNPVQYDALQ